MPSKRSRSKSVTKTSAKRSGSIKTTNVKKTWPFASKGIGPLWDPFPARASALMRYSTNITLSPITGAPASYLFRCNSIFDPDYTSVGHQPYGHDTYESIYNHYRVRKATITMTPMAAATGVFGITLTDDLSVNGDYDNIKEVKSTKMAPMPQGGGRQAVTNYYQKSQTFPVSTSDDSALFSANPTELTYFHCWYEAQSSTANPTNSDFLITISYEVDMWELKDLGKS